MKNLKIILLRHGETVWNREGRYQGRKDSPLTQKGIEQAQENAKKIEAYLKKEELCNNIDIYASPLGRARSTALILCDEMSIGQEEICFDNRIVEFDYGIFEGELKSYCQTHYAKEFQEREANKWFYQIEDGESYEMVAQRLKVWIDGLDRSKTVIMVAHEMINRALRGLYLHLEQHETLQLKQKNSVVLLLENGREEIIS